MDEVLLPYLQATSDSEKQQCLDDLLLVHASPVVRNTLRDRLGIHVSLAGSPSRHPEAEDLYHEILAKIVDLLRELDASSEQINIRSFRQYVARLATNARLPASQIARACATEEQSKRLAQPPS